MLTVTISPTAASTQTKPTVQFSASVSGDAKNLGVTWSADKGSIDQKGLYTAPTDPKVLGPAKVTATSVAEPAVSSFALVSLAVVPLTAEGLYLDAKDILTNTVRELQALADRDTFNSTNCNNVLSRLKKAIQAHFDQIAENARLVSTQEKAGEKTFVGAVTPSNVTLGLEEIEQFSASVNDPEVVWSASAGSITQAGLFTAPNAAGRVVVTATGKTNKVTATAVVTVG